MTRVVLGPNDSIEPCPKCGNNTTFEACSAQVAEDLCNVWVECVCGYDPTCENSLYRYEDVWGGVTGNTVGGALDCWNSAITDQED